ncbi:MAG TPA: hypothetical protein DC054_03020 [Blastocatellia bacterium]|nr:hypothetical protein [Blastocatellia bacterium]
MSEELEHSLQQAIETYLNDRLRTIDEQLSRLQTEVSEALARLRESSTAQSLDGSTVSAAIFAHLQTARGQRLSGATAASSAPPDAAHIKRAIQEIAAQQSQTDVLKSLLIGAVEFADRVALFVTKNDQAIGWRVCKASDPANLEMIGGVSLPLSAETIVTRAARARAPLSGSAHADSEDAVLMDQLGGSPAVVAAVPLIVRGKVVAVLYADSTSAGANAINSDALESLAGVASMAVNLVSIQHAAPVQQQPVPATETAVSQPQAAESAYEPEVEPATSAVATESVDEVSRVTQPLDSRPEGAAPESVSVAPPVTVHAQPVVEAAEPTSAAVEEPQSPTAEAPSYTAPADQIENVAQTAPPPSPPVAEPAPVFTSQYSTPLGSARRFGVSEPELPIEVSEDERRLHNDARRFARLLVSEIKLYNEPKVREGRSNGDLYDRLREDIDRSRQMYDKRVAPPVAARHDYFHQELVNTLAEGDVAKLGLSYPGAAVGVS